MGFNAGVDFQWMFNPNLGAGALVRITKATVDLNVDNRIIQVDAGEPRSWPASGYPSDPSCP